MATHTHTHPRPLWACCGRAADVPPPCSERARQVTLSKLTYVMHAYPTVSFALYQMASEVYTNKLVKSLKPAFPLLDLLGRLW